MNPELPELLNAEKVTEDPLRKLQDTLPVEISVVEMKTSVTICFSKTIKEISLSVVDARDVALKLRQAANRVEKRQREEKR